MLSPRSRGAAVALLFLFLPIRAAYAAPLTADDAVRAALQHDAALARAESDLLAARGNLRSSSGLRQNPRVGARVASSYLEVEAVQPFSLTGEGISASRSARAERDAAARIDAIHASESDALIPGGAR